MHGRMQHVGMHATGCMRMKRDLQALISDNLQLVPPPTKQVVFAEASRRAGRTVDRVVTIMDAAGLTLGMLTGFAQRVRREPACGGGGGAAFEGPGVSTEQRGENTGTRAAHPQQPSSHNPNFNNNDSCSAP
jgi:hypothetical protein